jgi:hypothetical protein
LGVFEIVVAVAVQSIFHLEMHQNNWKTYKNKLNFLKKNLKK